MIVWLSLNLSKCLLRPPFIRILGIKKLCCIFGSSNKKSIVQTIIGDMNVYTDDDGGETNERALRILHRAHEVETNDCKFYYAEIEQRSASNCP